MITDGLVGGKLFHTISNTTKENERREIKKTVEKRGTTHFLKNKK